MKNLNIVDLLKILIIILWVYLIYNESITLNRIITFITVFLLIIVHSKGSGIIIDIFENKKVQEYIKLNSEKFRKVVYVLLEVYKWINPFFAFLIYTDKCLYKVNHYISGTKYIRYNFIIYVILKYLVMFGLIKLIVYQYYSFWHKLDNLTIMDILFKRMYGLILSVLVFTDVLNNLISYLSHYGIGIYIFIYYITSSICVIGELLSFDYLIKLYLNIIKKYKGYKYVTVLLSFVTNIMNFIDTKLGKCTKMNLIIFLRSQFTGLGLAMMRILEIISPRIVKESNFKETFISVERFSETSFMTSGRIAYYIAQKNRVPFKYFYYIGSLMNIGYFEVTFQLLGESYKNYGSYNNLFKLKSEIKGKPSIFLYKQLFDLANLLDIHNQPINRLMDGMYFEIKSKEYSNLLDEGESLIVKRNLSYFKSVDTLRAKLMYNIIGDIEYFYNNNKDYNGNYGIIKGQGMLEILIFKIDNRSSFILLSPNTSIFNQFINLKKELKFYDPEENMEYLNRLFNVLGVVDNFYEVPFDSNVISDKYYVSDKFNNYNAKYEELLKIMYTHDFKRGEESQCECSYVSSYEVEIAYKIEDFMLNLRKEGTESLQLERLEERNGRLLKELEELM